MTKKPKKKPQQNVFSEAWQNMSADMNQHLPEKLRSGKAKGKFAVIVLIVELVVFGLIGKLVYDWLAG